MKSLPLKNRASYTRDFTEQGWVSYCLAENTRYLSEMARVCGVKNPEFFKYCNRQIRLHAKSASKQSTRA